MVQETKVVGFRATPEFDREMRVAAALRDQNKSELIREAVSEKLAELRESLGGQAPLSAATDVTGGEQ